ncbi:MAG: hypothetical protein FWD54_00955 [Endomicrobia bacterium]|nr:hypothetical protein [Endomicrobiia bacterium]MCL2798841.1 hypothetical protein [Endomicrobiia bacterium]
MKKLLAVLISTSLMSSAALAAPNARSGSTPVNSANNTASEKNTVSKDVSSAIREVSEKSAPAVKNTAPAKNNSVTNSASKSSNNNTKNVFSTSSVSSRPSNNNNIKAAPAVPAKNSNVSVAKPNSYTGVSNSKSVPTVNSRQTSGNNVGNNVSKKPNPNVNVTEVNRNRNNYGNSNGNITTTKNYDIKGNRTDNRNNNKTTVINSNKTVVNNANTNRTVINNRNVKKPKVVINNYNNYSTVYTYPRNYYQRYNYYNGIYYKNRGYVNFGVFLGLVGLAAIVHYSTYYIPRSTYVSYNYWPYYRYDYYYNRPRISISYYDSYDPYWTYYDSVYYEQQERRAALAEINKLEDAKASAIHAERSLAYININNASFYKVYTTDALPVSVAEVTVTNDSNNYISAIYFRGTLQTHITNKILIDDAFSYYLPEPLEPGESATYRISLNAFGSWASVKPSDMTLFGVSITGIKTVDGRSIRSESFTEQDQARLDSLKARYGY